jgi:transcriptional regulator with XRE-family HTH domain
MSVTLSDIAKDLNISAVTVSKVLRNKGRISAHTRSRVLKRAKELDYRPNWVARSLVTRRTYTIGLLLPDFTHPFFADIAKTIAETVRPRGYHVIISYFEEDPDLERVEADSLLARRVDGLILASSQTPDRPELFEQLRARKVQRSGGEIGDHALDRARLQENCAFARAKYRAGGQKAEWLSGFVEEKQAGGAHGLCGGCRLSGPHRLSGDEATA